MTAFHPFFEYLMNIYFIDRAEIIKFAVETSTWIWYHCGNKKYRGWTLRTCPRSSIADATGGGFEVTEQRLNQYKQLGLTIAYYRKLKGITQQALAEAVSLSRTHISNLEAPNMPTSISLEKLFDIAEVLNVPVKNFFDFRD